MSEQNRAFSRDSQRSAPARSMQIDRLVLGDLDESERLELLAWLDESPGRWRRCGLAFLEAQTLREALAEMDSGTRPLAAPGDAKRRPGYRVARAAAGVVALMLAFALGWSSHRGLRSPAEQVVAERSAEHQRGAIDELPETPDRESSEELPPVNTAHGDGLAMLHFRTGSGEEARELSVPVRFADGAIQVLDQPTELPEYVRQQWERRGYHVSRQRRTLHLTLANGSQLNVPVDQFRLTYVGQPLL